MRENNKILNQTDDRKNITTPVVYAVLAVIALIGLLIWFGIKQPVLFNNIRDLVITLILFLFFVFNTAVAVLSFYLAARINGARDQIDKSISTADGKVEELAEKTAVLLGKILEPFIKYESGKAGFLSLFSRNKTEK